LGGDRRRVPHRAAAAAVAVARRTAAAGEHPADRRPQRLAPPAGPVRPADHRVPHLRATRAVRHLAPDPQLVEDVPLLVLKWLVRRTTCEEWYRPASPQWRWCWRWPRAGPAEAAVATR